LLGIPSSREDEACRRAPVNVLQIPYGGCPECRRDHRHHPIGGRTAPSDPRSPCRGVRRQPARGEGARRRRGGPPGTETPAAGEAGVRVRSVSCSRTTRGHPGDAVEGPRVRRDHPGIQPRTVSSAPERAQPLRIVDVFLQTVGYRELLGGTVGWDEGGTSSPANPLRARVPPRLGHGPHPERRRRVRRGRSRRGRRRRRRATEVGILRGPDPFAARVVGDGSP